MAGRSAGASRTCGQRLVIDCAGSARSPLIPRPGGPAVGRLVSAEVVLADARIVRAAADGNADLRAPRGGPSRQFEKSGPVPV
jgi:hypothetical protein